MVLFIVEIITQTKRRKNLKCYDLKLIENGGVTHNFESGPPKDHFNPNF
jgi:hypothetical protein